MHLWYNDCKPLEAVSVRVNLATAWLITPEKMQQQDNEDAREAEASAKAAEERVATKAQNLATRVATAQAAINTLANNANASDSEREYASFALLLLQATRTADNDEREFTLPSRLFRFR